MGKELPIGMMRCPNCGATRPLTQNSLLEECVCGYPKNRSNLPKSLFEMIKDMQKEIEELKKAVIELLNYKKDSKL